jgi:hypothetical protein
LAVLFVGLQQLRVELLMVQIRFFQMIIFQKGVFCFLHYPDYHSGCSFG